MRTHLGITDPAKRHQVAALLKKWRACLRLQATACEMIEQPSEEFDQQYSMLLQNDSLLLGAKIMLALLSK